MSGNQRIALGTVAATLAVGFGAGRATAPTPRPRPAPAIGTAISHYPPCTTPRWAPGPTAGPCVTKP